MQTALPRPDDEGMTGCRPIEEFNPLTGEIVTGLAAESLACTKPPICVGGHPLTNRPEALEERMVGLQCTAVEDVVVDQGAPPFAVAPVLNPRDGFGVFDQVLEGSGPAGRPDDQIPDSTSTSQKRARDPRMCQTETKTAAARVVVDYAVLGSHGYGRVR